MLCTSRPAGLTKERFAGFCKLQMSPLTEAQQKEALQQRLGAERVGPLLEYVEDRVPLDTETGQRVTANPLMLSMVASIFELRQGVGMPETTAELYKESSEAMLKRGGAASAELRRLLQRVFFEVHVSQHREIEDRQLDEAALGLEQPEALAAIREQAKAGSLPPCEERAELGHFEEVVKEGKRGVITKDNRSCDPYKVTFADGTTSKWLRPEELHSSGMDETAFCAHAMASKRDELRAACTQLSHGTRNALEEMRRRVAQDQLPLISLLQTEPLRLQSSHLSFQEYFAARTLCKGEDGGARLSEAPPWQWPAWWANAVKLGSDMDGFGSGMLRAAGMEGDTLDLTEKLGGDRATVLAALCTTLKGHSILTSLK